MIKIFRSSSLAFRAFDFFSFRSVNFCKLISYALARGVTRLCAVHSVGCSYVLTRVRVCACQETTTVRHDQSISAGNKIWKNVIPRKVENAITLNRICNLHPISAWSGVERTTVCDRFDLRCGYHNRSAIISFLSGFDIDYMHAPASHRGDRRTYLCGNNVTKYVHIL